MVYTVLPIFFSIQYLSRGAQTARTRKRDAFETRFERMGLALVLSLVIWCCPVLIAGLLLRSMEVMRSWAFGNAVVFGLQTFVYYAAVSRPNRRALTARNKRSKS